MSEGRPCAVVTETYVGIGVDIPSTAPQGVVDELLGLGFRVAGYRWLVWWVSRDDPEVRARIKRLHELKDNKDRETEFWELYISTLELMEKRYNEMRAKVREILSKYSLEICK